GERPPTKVAGATSATYCIVGSCGYVLALTDRGTICNALSRVGRVVISLTPPASRGGACPACARIVEIGAWAFGHWAFPSGNAIRFDRHRRRGAAIEVRLQTQLRFQPPRLGG